MFELTPNEDRSFLGLEIGDAESYAEYMRKDVYGKDGWYSDEFVAAVEDAFYSYHTQDLGYGEAEDILGRIREELQNWDFEFIDMLYTNDKRYSEDQDYQDQIVGDFFDQDDHCWYGYTIGEHYDVHEVLVHLDMSTYHYDIMDDPDREILLEAWNPAQQDFGFDGRRELYIADKDLMSRADRGRLYSSDVIEYYECKRAALKYCIEPW